MNFIESYPNALSIEKCQQICDRIDDILSRPDPGSACILSNDATRTDWNIFTGRYGSLKLLEDSVVDAVHAGWRKYNKQYGAASRAFLIVYSWMEVSKIRNWWRIPPMAYRTRFGDQ